MQASLLFLCLKLHDSASLPPMLRSWNFLHEAFCDLASLRFSIFIPELCLVPSLFEIPWKHQSIFCLHTLYKRCLDKWADFLALAWPHPLHHSKFSSSNALSGSLSYHCCPHFKLSAPYSFSMSSSLFCLMLGTVIIWACRDQ